MWNARVVEPGFERVFACQNVKYIARATNDTPPTVGACHLEVTSGKT